MIGLGIHASFGTHGRLESAPGREEGRDTGDSNIPPRRRVPGAGGADGRLESVPGSTMGASIGEAGRGTEAGETAAMGMPFPEAKRPGSSIEVELEGGTSSAGTCSAPARL